MSANDGSPTSAYIRAERFELVSRIADEISHEVKNPLHAMVISLELLKRRIAGGEVESALERVVVIEDQVGRLNELIESLLKLLRGSRDEGESAELDSVVADLMPLLRVQSKLAHMTLEWSSAASGASIPLSREVLRHVVLTMAAVALDGARAGAGDRLLLASETDAAGIRFRVAPGFGRATGGPGEEGAGWEPDQERLELARTLTEAAGGGLELEAGGGGEPAALVLRFPRPRSA